MPYQITCDIHTHTLFSRHAYSTIMENLVAARDAGLQVLGSADHFSDMLLPSRTSATSSIFLNVDVWPRKRMAWCCSAAQRLTSCRLTDICLEWISRATTVSPMLLWANHGQPL